MPRVPATLAREWAAKLAAAGFEDIELADGSLRDPAHRTRRRLRRPDTAGNAAYYRRAAQWTHMEVWASRRLRRLWELHAEGHAESAIARLMGPSPQRHHRMIWPFLERARARMADWWVDAADEDAPTPSLMDQELATIPTYDVPVDARGVPTRRRDRRTTGGW